MAIPENIEKLANDVRTKIYGKDVREALASGIEAAGETAEDARIKSEDTEKRQTSLEKQFDDQIANMTLADPSSAELVAGRTNVNTGESYDTIGRRLDAEHADVTAQLAQNAEVIYFNYNMSANALQPLIIPTYDGSNQTCHPCVLYFEESWNGYKYWMAHTPYPNSDDDFENPSISVSHDGLNWFDPPGITNPIDIPTQAELDDGWHMSDTHLLVVNGVMECWYRLNKNNVKDQLLRKTSTDGINWSEREVMHELTGVYMALSPAIVHDGSKYRLWYVDEWRNTFYKESIDGKNWSAAEPVEVNHINAPTDYKPWHLNVTYDGSQYMLLINSGIANQPLATDRKALFLGFSSDPLNFTVEPILYPSHPNSGRWDNYMLYRSSIVKVGSLYRMYYSAMSMSERWYIGLTESEDLKKWYGAGFVNQDGNLTNVNDFRPQGNMYLKNGKWLWTNDAGSSYLKGDKLKLVKPNVAGVQTEVEKLDTLTIKSDSGDKGGFIDVAGLQFTHNNVPNTSNLKPGYFFYDSDKNNHAFHNGEVYLNYIPFSVGTTATRPTNLNYFMLFFDTTIYKMIYYNHLVDKWFDFDGNEV